MCVKNLKSNLSSLESSNKEHCFQYFIFGEDYVRIFENGGVDRLVSKINSDEGLSGAIERFDVKDGNVLVNILESYDGFDGWIPIYNEDYERLMAAVEQF